jgi:hypothetical protein
METTKYISVMEQTRNSSFYINWPTCDRGGKSYQSHVTDDGIKNELDFEMNLNLACECHLDMVGTEDIWSI